MKKYALLSVYDKTGILPLARNLTNKGYTILSSGGTYRAINDEIPVTEIAEYTGFPEILGGRVKTLHPKIHGGILAKRNDSEHKKELSRFEISKIDIVVVNLYPFKETIKIPDISYEKVIEQIDIGGVALIRAAAKNNMFVSVLTSPKQYDEFIKILDTDKLNSNYRIQLASEAFMKTSEYDKIIMEWINIKKGL